MYKRINISVISNNTNKYESMYLEAISYIVLLYYVWFYFIEIQQSPTTTSAVGTGPSPMWQSDTKHYSKYNKVCV